MQEVQTRDDEGRINHFPSVHEAFEYAARNQSVWKISWEDTDGQRVRLVRARRAMVWKYEPIDLALINAVAEQDRLGKTGPGTEKQQ